MEIKDINIPKALTLLLWQMHLISFGSIQALSISLLNSLKAEKGKDTQVICQSGLASGNLFTISQTTTADNMSARTLAQCFDVHCFPSSIGRYTITSDRVNLRINITQLVRNEDEKFWTCSYDVAMATMFLTVYTSPTSSLLTSSFVDSYSLSDGPATFTCRTDKCAYKDPEFKWYIVFANGTQQRFKLGVSSSRVSASACNDSENIYHNILRLQQNMTFHTNADVTVQFICGISFPTLEDDLLSTPSGNLSFAVHVTSLQIFDGGLEMSDGSILTVNDNVSHSVTCKPGPSRPSPTYALYLGTSKVLKSNNNILTFIPTRNLHHVEIYCTAYNLQDPKNAVVSKRLRLYVNIPVTKAFLYDDSFQLNSYSFINASEGILKSLTCTSDESRPSPVFLWYVDNQIRQNHSSNVFTFTPQMNDHDKILFCMAYNVQGYAPAESSKPKLYVTGRPVQPRIFLFTGFLDSNTSFYWIAGFNGGFKQSFIVQYKLITSYVWKNSTVVTEMENQSEYTLQIKNIERGIYQARLVAKNSHGEATPVNISGSSFQIMSTTSESAVVSQPTVITGTTLGCVILLLCGTIVYQCFLLKRKQLHGHRSEIQLTHMSDSTNQMRGQYQDLQTDCNVGRSTYVTLESPAFTVQSSGSSFDNAYEVMLREK